MFKIIKFILEISLVLTLVAIGFFTVEAFAQQCSTYYDQVTGRFCSICLAPGGTPVVNCY